MTTISNYTMTTITQPPPSTHLRATRNDFNLTFEIKHIQFAEKKEKENNTYGCISNSNYSSDISKLCTTELTMVDTTDIKGLLVSYGSCCGCLHTFSWSGWLRPLFPTSQSQASRSMWLHN